MIENPMFKEKEFYKQCKVVYIDREIIQKDTSIESYCLQQQIPFSVRRFNSIRYYEDSDHVLRLPAIHFYINKKYQGTYYPLEDPILSIENEIRMYREQQEIRDLKKNNTWNRLRSFFHM